MLEAFRAGWRRARFPLAVAAAAALAVSTSGCLALFEGVNDTTVDFPIQPTANGTFWGWTEITIGADISSVNSATLVAVTLNVETPAGTPDLSFLQSLKAEAVTPTARTTVATLDSFPAGEQAVILDIQYHGDLHPLFKNADTIRIEWSGSTNPAFTAWPPNGFVIQGDVKIDIE